MCDHDVGSDGVCRQCGEYVALFVNYQPSSYVKLSYNDYLHLSMIETILNNLSCPKYKMQIFSVYKSLKLKEKVSNIIKIKSIIYHMLRKHIKLSTIADNRTERYKILRTNMLNFTYDHLNHSYASTKRCSNKNICRNISKNNTAVNDEINQIVKNGFSLRDSRYIKRKLDVVHQLHKNKRLVQD